MAMESLSQHIIIHDMLIHDTLAFCCVSQDRTLNLHLTMKNSSLSPKREMTPPEEPKKNTEKTMPPFQSDHCQIFFTKEKDRRISEQMATQLEKQENHNWFLGKAMAPSGRWNKHAVTSNPPLNKLFQGIKENFMVLCCSTVLSIYLTPAPLSHRYMLL